jgi:hypothetical protein
MPQELLTFRKSGCQVNASAFERLNVEANRPFQMLRVTSLIQFGLNRLRGSCVASTYSVEDGPKPVI